MLPHGVAAPKQRRLYPSPWMRTAPSGAPDLFGTSKLFLLVLAVAVPSFLLGTTVTLYAGVDCTSKMSMPVSKSDHDEALIERRVNQLVKEREESLFATHTELVRKMVEKQCGDQLAAAAATGRGETEDASSHVMIDPKTVGNMIAGIALTPKSNFTDTIDLGVPLDALKTGSDHAMILYSSSKAMPNKLMSLSKKQTYAPTVSVDEALENCEYLRVLLLDHSSSRKQCLALVPQYESYHLQPFMRAPVKSNRLHATLDPNEPLHLVSRGLNGNGKEDFPPPGLGVIKNTFDMLKTYLNSLDQVLDDLKSVIKNDMKPYNGKIIVVMVSNFGQSELLMNFVCHAKTKNLDLSAVLVFATDRETEELSNALGLAAYYDERNFGSIPSEAARMYGDSHFSAMMIAKVICVQLISYLGYDLLFQDVDIIWFKHPLSDYFGKQDHWTQKYDTIFQDDGGHSLRYAPYSANSGFYFARNNLKTRNFFNSLLMSSAMILKTSSHQQAMIAVLNEHVSLYGMQVKVVSRDVDDMPGGYQWNMKSDKYMKAFFRGELDPVIFHMSWTSNKDNKLKYFQQMGAWHVEEKCIAQKKSDIPGDTDKLISSCCSAEPIFKCHYRDKPSLYPCKDSPPLRKNNTSFW